MSKRKTAAQVKKRGFVKLDYVTDAGKKYNLEIAKMWILSMVCVLLPHLVFSLLIYKWQQHIYVHTPTQVNYCCHWSGNPASNCLIDLFSPSLLHSPLTIWNRWLALLLVALGDWSNNCRTGSKLPRHVCCMTSRIGFIMIMFEIKRILLSVFVLDSLRVAFVCFLCHIRNVYT